MPVTELLLGLSSTVLNLSQKFHLHLQYNFCYYHLSSIKDGIGV